MLEFNYNSNHLEGNTLTYGQTMMLLLFGKVTDSADMKDLEDMKASNACLKVMKEQAEREEPLTEVFIRQLHKTLLREDYTVHRQAFGGQQTSCTIHAGTYKTRPNSVVTATGETFEYASPEETPALMTDLVGWYQSVERTALHTPAELCALFHYRLIRIHPFEDGNGRMARLLVNFILLRHGCPMIVVKSNDRDNYLGALRLCDVATGTVPSEGAHAELKDIQPLVAYLSECLRRALSVSIKAAKGESISEDEDFAKELSVLQRQKRQEASEGQAHGAFEAKEIWDVLELVFYPMAEEFDRALNTIRSVFPSIHTESHCFFSKRDDIIGGIIVKEARRDTEDSKVREYVYNAKSVWYLCSLTDPSRARARRFEIKGSFHISFRDDCYLVEGINGKEFPYGHYPTEAERKGSVDTFKERLLRELNEKL